MWYKSKLELKQTIGFCFEGKLLCIYGNSSSMSLYDDSCSAVKESRIRMGLGAVNVQRKAKYVIAETFLLGFNTLIV
jgi:hypothetical protein